MFSTVFKEVSSVLDRRFVINAFFPSLLFWSLLGVVFFAGQGMLDTMVQAWNEQDIGMKLIQSVGFVAWVTFFAGLLTSQQTAILRFFEGYWNIPLIGNWLKRLGQRWYQKRLGALDPNDDADYENIYLNYPSPSRISEVMPTRLGNILKSAELYPNVRYKLDAVLVWPRLYNLFPESFVKTLVEAKSAMDFMLMISILGGAFGLVAGIYLLVACAPWWLFLLCAWGGSAVAGMAYQGILGSARLYAEQIRTAFDLYRHELLKQMRLKLPDSLSDEKVVWDAVNQLLYRNNPWEHPEVWRYAGEKPRIDEKKGETWLRKLTKCLKL